MDEDVIKDNADLSKHSRDVESFAKMPVGPGV